MTSRTAIRKLIDDVEVDYQKCWEVLHSLKEHQMTDAFAIKLVGFQETLAAALFRLDESYRLIAQERNNLIRKKATLNADWFLTKIRSLAEYQEAIKKVIKIGKALGDSFAWFFYQNERQLLLKHLEHERIDHTPPGIGGRGELEFIRRVKRIDDQIVLYHGITTFLRIGDFSLVKVRSLSVTALGELKTKQISPNELQISFNLISPQPVIKAKPASSALRNDAALPQHVEQVLQRQIKQMAASFAHRRPDKQLTINSDFHFDELKQLALELNKKSVVYMKAGDGLLLIGLRASHTKSLSSRLLGRSSPDINKRVKDSAKQAQRLIDTDQVNESNNSNSIIIGSFDFETAPGTIPFFWWPAPLELIKSFFFYEVMVITLYNPAHLIKKLRALGFDVQLQDKGHIQVTKIIDETELQIGMDYFINVIQTNLMNEDAVVGMLSDLLKRAEAGEIPEDSMVQLQLQFFWR